MQASVTVIEVQEKRIKWKETIQKNDAGHLVFLDESGVNTNLTRRYGRSIGKARVEDHTPLNTPKTTTVLSSMRADGSKATVTYMGGTTGVRFVDYLKTVLIPTLKPGDIVVMDNLRSHHVKDVQKLFDRTQFQVTYLPPYSPDLNPIEKMWSKMKSILRKWKVREVSALPHSIEAALRLVSAEECTNWFRSCGYR
jgi:transposase